MPKVCELALRIAFILMVRGTNGLGYREPTMKRPRTWRTLDKVVSRR